MSFAENGNYFVTAGNRHVKFWYLEYSRSKYQEPTPLTGRSAILGEQVCSLTFCLCFLLKGNCNELPSRLQIKRRINKVLWPYLGVEQRNNYFCDVACGRGEMGDSTFAITKSGLLCEFNNRRLLDKWVELRVSYMQHLKVSSYEVGKTNKIFFIWWYILVMK